MMVIQIGDHNSPNGLSIIRLALTCNPARRRVWSRDLACMYCALQFHATATSIHTVHNDISRLGFTVVRQYYVLLRALLLLQVRRVKRWSDNIIHV